MPTEYEGRDLDAEGRPPITGPAIVRDLERTLGLGVIVQSIDAGPTFVIRAQLMLGPHSEAVAGIGPTEAEAWRKPRPCRDCLADHERQAHSLVGGGG